jgi:hypothetical protein
MWYERTTLMSLTGQLDHFTFAIPLCCIKLLLQHYYYYLVALLTLLHYLVTLITTINWHVID